jgi:hypothetical protein
VGSVGARIQCLHLLGRETGISTAFESDPPLIQFNETQTIRPLKRETLKSRPAPSNFPRDAKSAIAAISGGSPSFVSHRGADYTHGGGVPNIDKYRVTQASRVD